MADELVNRVSQSGIITIDLEDFYPREDVVVFDMKDFLYMGLILKEKVAVVCTADAIIPMWAYMLISSILQPVARSIFFGEEKEAIGSEILKNLGKIDPAEYAEKRIVIKGCGEREIPAEAYVAVTAMLRPVAKSIMYGEPCSTVPVFKKQA